MKIKFKKQAYQTNAVEAVADCFAGQPKIKGLKYRIDPGLVKPGGQQTRLDDDAGFKNNELAFTPLQLLENIHSIQHRQNLPLSADLAIDKKSGCAVNLDIEMETGTGKTYCYIKTMFELNKRYGDSVAILRKLVLGIQAQASSKNYATN